MAKKNEINQNAQDEYSGLKIVTAGTVITHIVLILLCIVCVMPFVLIIMSSLASEKTLMAYGYTFWPKEWSLYNYTYILGGGGVKVLRGYLNSLIVTAVGTTLSLCMTMLFAYPLSRKDFPDRKLIAFLLFFTMLFHGGIVPMYMTWTQMFHIKDTYWALILPSLLMNAFYVIMMRTYLTATIPTELIEAAKMDKASEFRILVSIIIPLSKPMIATIGFMVALGYWNDWLNGLYFIEDTNLMTIQNILNRMLLDVQFLASAQATQVSSVGDLTANIPTTGIRMSVAVLGVLPILIIYPFFQKYLIKGIMIGGVKG